jgi:hypothetical protein
MDTPNTQETQKGWVEKAAETPAGKTFEHNGQTFLKQADNTLKQVEKPLLNGKPAKILAEKPFEVEAKPKAKPAESEMDVLKAQLAELKADFSESVSLLKQVMDENARLRVGIVPAAGGSAIVGDPNTYTREIRGVHQVLRFAGKPSGVVLAALNILARGSEAYELTLITKKRPMSDFNAAMKAMAGSTKATVEGCPGGGGYSGQFARVESRGTWQFRSKNFDIVTPLAKVGAVLAQ